MKDRKLWGIERLTICPLFFNDPAFDEPKTNNIENALGTSLRYQVPKLFQLFITFVHSRAGSWHNLYTLLTVFRNNCIVLQKYYYARIMPDAPDIVLCSKSCRHTPTDSSPVMGGHSLDLRIDKFSFLG